MHALIKKINQESLLACFCLKTHVRCTHKILKKNSTPFLDYLFLENHGNKTHNFLEKTTQESTRTSLCSLLLSLETPNDVQSVA